MFIKASLHVRMKLAYGVDRAAGEGKFMWSEPEIVVVIALGRNEFTQCVLSSLFE